MTLGVVARVRRALYGAGLLPAERLPRPVVSVGNLVLGGAGKTPHVLHIARWLSGSGFRVAILSRGYGRRSRGVVWVSRGDGHVASSRDAATAQPTASSSVCPSGMGPANTRMHGAPRTTE